MNLTTYILAVDETALGKFLVFGVFALIWVVSQVASVLAKKAEEQKRKRMLEMQRAPAPMQRSAQRSGSSRPTIPPMRASQTPKPQRVKIKAPPPLPKKRTSSSPFATGSKATATPPPPVAQTLESSPKRQTAATAQALHTWLRPSTLRQQFILTEVLQPPLALRNSESSRRL